MENKLNLESLKQKFLNDEISAEEYKSEKEKLEKVEEAQQEKEQAQQEQARQETEKERLEKAEEKAEEEKEAEEIKKEIEEEKVELTEEEKKPKTAKEKGKEEPKTEIIKKTRAKKEKKKKSKEEKYVYECEGCGRKYNSYGEAEECEKTHDCCAHVKDRKKGVINGIIYGLVPHTFCILFIIGSILGVTLFTSFFKPFLANRNFFYILIALSFTFATLSALFYLKRNNCLCVSGAKKRWKFLSILYTTTIIINLLFFFVIFPVLANVSIASAKPISGAAIQNTNNYPSLTLKVNIPCSGHAPLIIGELKKVQGVVDVKYKSGKFNVAYDSSKTSKESILSLEVFKTYPATVVSESESANERDSEGPSTGGGSCCGSGSCGCGGGGSCGV